MKTKKRSLGFIFGENLQFSKIRKNIPSTVDLETATSWSEKKETSFQNQKKIVANWRIYSFYIFVSILLITLMTRAFELQVIKGIIFLGKATGNHARVVVDHAPRGVIYDRNGIILAQNKPGFSLYIEKSFLKEKNKSKLIKKTAEIFDIDKSDISSKLEKSNEEKVLLSSSITSDQAIKFESIEESLVGVRLEVNPVRLYPYREIISHVLGYTGEVNQKELDRRKLWPYQSGDKIGRSGIEQSMESTLRGTNGYTLVNVSADGTVLGDLYQNTPVSGQSITLSIDINLQKYVFDLLKNKIRREGLKAGSAVVMDSKSGEILALVSYPSFDNNFFSEKISQESYQNLIGSPKKLLLNRAIASAYPPGSTFKIVTSTAGLETGTINRNSKIEDRGYVKLGNQVFNNWLWTDQHKTEGEINVVRALARSTDTFYYELGRQVGEKNIEKYARMLGLGDLTGIELPEEIKGLVPSEEWKQATKGESWYPGETLNISIGQGDLLVTPLQITSMTGVFANGGILITPTILKTDKADVAKKSFLKKPTISIVQEGLYRNTVGDGNVGWLFAGSPFKSAGKTGTAEAGERGPHAWYTGYFPYSDSSNSNGITATVMFEHAGHGSEESAPIVKKIFEWWYKNK